VGRSKLTVIVGLRPYTSKANILPEQRSARLALDVRGMERALVERVDVIGNKGFIKFVEDLEREEEVEARHLRIGKDKVVIVTIAPDSAKLDKDIGMPQLTPILTRKKSISEEIATLDVMSLRLRFFQGRIKAKKLSSSATKVTISSHLRRRSNASIRFLNHKRRGSDWFLCAQIAQDVSYHRNSQRSFRSARFLEKKAFGEDVDLNGPGWSKRSAAMSLPT